MDIGIGIHGYRYAGFRLGIDIRDTRIDGGGRGTGYSSGVLVPFACPCFTAMEFDLFDGRQPALRVLTFPNIRNRTWCRRFNWLGASMIPSHALGVESLAILQTIGFPPCGIFHVATYHGFTMSQPLFVATFGVFQHLGFQGLYVYRPSVCLTR